MSSIETIHPIAKDLTRTLHFCCVWMRPQSSGWSMQTGLKTCANWIYRLWHYLNNRGE